jgi:mono/diheme cytochrome c family protein
LKTFLHVVLGIFVAAVLALVGFVIWAERRPSIAEISTPQASSFDKAAIARGATLVVMGDCAQCHTAAGGEPLAGGYPLPTPFGTIYGSNITPDPQTGIGGWSEAAFARAMREGISRDGSYLYPAFPYPHFTLVSDQDIQAIYAFLMTRPPVHNAVPAPQLPFPLNIRLAMAGWNLLFFEPGRFKPVTGQSEAWNRGAYIAEGLGHCGACHTPLNPLGAEIRQRRYAGGAAEGWDAPALNAASPAPIPWTEQQLRAYFNTGFAADHGMAAGPMMGVTADLQNLPEADVTALATYIASFAPAASATNTAAANAAAEKTAYEVTTAQGMEQKGPAKTGEAVFASACASCHFEGGSQPFYRPVPLALSSVVNAPTPRNLIQIVMNGIEPPPGGRGHWMPPFGAALTDQQIAQVANYARSRFSSKPAWADTAKLVGEIRKDSGS